MAENEKLPPTPPGSYVPGSPNVFAGVAAAFRRLPSVVFDPVSLTAAPVVVRLSVPGHPLANVYYTLDGSVPNLLSGHHYFGPLEFNTSTEVAAIAYEPGYSASPVVRASYPLANTLPAVTFNPEDGTTPLNVALSVSGYPDAQIRYTLNGTTPTGSSPLYSTPLALTGTVAVKALALRPGLQNGPVSSAFYTPAALPAVFVAPQSGTLPLDIFLAVSGHPDATIYYMLDAGPLQVYNGALVHVSRPTAFYTYATKPGYKQSPVTRLFYPGKLPSVVFTTQVVGNETPNVLLMEVSGHPGAAIYYTDDGSQPTISSKRYDPSFPPYFPAGKTINAFAVEAPYDDSDVAQFVLLNQNSVPAVAFIPVSGSTVPFSGPEVTLSVGLVGATIRYTADGSTPTDLSALYSGPIPGAAVIKAKAFKGSSSGPVSTASYTQPKVATPSFSPPGGAVPISVDLVCSTPGANLFWAGGGLPPTNPWTGTVFISSVATLKGQAKKAGWIDSDIVTALYGTQVFVDPVSFTPLSGTPVPLPGSLQISMASATAGSSIFYSTNPAEQTPPATPYSGPVTINGTTAFRAQATKAGLTPSLITSAQYFQPPDEFSFFFLDKTSDKAGSWGTFSPAGNSDFHFALYFDFTVSTEILRVFVTIVRRFTITNVQNTSPIVVETLENTSGAPGSLFCDVEQVGGCTAANGYERAFTRITGNQLRLTGTTGNGAYTTGGHLYIGGYPLATVADGTQSWATFNAASPGGPPWYPLVLFNGATQLNSAYLNSQGFFVGFTRIDAYGDIVSIPSNWFKCWITLGDGRTLRRYVNFA